MAYDHALVGDLRKLAALNDVSSLSRFVHTPSVIELQAFIVELLSNFEFTATPKIDKIRREAALVMVPTIEGELEKGSQLPLRVTFAPKGGD